MVENLFNKFIKCPLNCLRPYLNKASILEVEANNKQVNKYPK